jgi:hypothetical protein
MVIHSQVIFPAVWSRQLFILLIDMGKSQPKRLEKSHRNDVELPTTKRKISYSRQQQAKISKGDTMIIMDFTLYDQR